LRLVSTPLCPRRVGAGIDVLAAVEVVQRPLDGVMSAPAGQCIDYQLKGETTDGS